MNNYENIARIKELTSLLNKYRDKYYNYSESLVSDAEYDKLFDELRELETEENFILSNSPTQTVGYEVVDSLKKVKHDHLMLSLDKTKSCQDLLNFAEDREVALSMKLDGLTMSVKYENGKLVSAETRGNGVEGTDVLNNAKVMKNLPLTIDSKETLVIDGECIILRDDFERINAELPDGEQYATQRNLASGSLSLLDNKITSQRGLQFWAWSLIEGTTGSFRKDMNKLQSLGFTIVHCIYFNGGNVDLYGIEDLTIKLKQTADKKGIPVDGCVITYDDIAYGLSLGNTGHHFRKSLAFKYEDETAGTILRDIEWAVGKTGVITPTAVFDSIILDNTEVSRASVHNISIIKSLGLRKNCTVKVAKMNMIIPQIVFCNKDGDADFEIPKTCPCCGKPTTTKISESGAETLWCENPDCPEKNLAKFVQFVSKQAMNIDGLSEATLKRFIEEGFISRFADIYHLSKYEKEIINMNGFGEKSYLKLISSIEKSRKVKLENLLVALSISNIGKSAAKVISKYFNGDWMKFEEALENNFDFSQLEDFGEITNKSLYDWWNSNNPIECNLLLELTIWFEKPSEKIENDFINGKTFCVTGSFHTLKRNEIEKVITDRGGKLSGSVSKKTDFLLTNEANSGSSKAKKAAELGTPIMSEEDFLKRIGK